MRRRKTEIQRRVNGNLRLSFSKSDLTSYAGLELLIRYFRIIELNRMIRSYMDRTGLIGDYGVTRMVRIFLGLFIVGAKRLRHILYLNGDPVFERFCGLACLPSNRTLSRWLKSFSGKAYLRLQDLSDEIVSRMIRKLPLRTLTLDVDGTVLSTGENVSGALRGYNHHNRRVHWLFTGSEKDGNSAALFLSLIGCCRKCDLNPWEYLTDIFRRIMSHPANRLRELLPDQWKAGDE